MAEERLLTPRLSPKAESMTANYVEQAGYVKLSFPEGEIDFVASGPLTQDPYETESIFGRPIRVETSTEIVAKKVWYRGPEFTARDVFDLALVAEKEPGALHEIKPILRDRRNTILQRIATHEKSMREAFAQLEILEYKRTFDECVTRVRDCLDQA